MDIITRSTNGDGCWFLFYHGEMKKNYEKEQARPGLDGGFNGEAGTPGMKGIDGTDGLHGTQGQ